MEPIDQRLDEYLASHPGITIEVIQELLWLAAAAEDRQDGL
jgi:hypothetical protein